MVSLTFGLWNFVFGLLKGECKRFSFFVCVGIELVL